MTAPGPGSATASTLPAKSAVPRRLQWTGLLMGFSGAGFVLALLFSPGTTFVGELLLTSFSLLMFYRLVLLFVFIGVEGAWDGVRKWRVRHWHDTPDRQGEG